jgi:hypothetical protein
MAKAKRPWDKPDEKPDGRDEDLQILKQLGTFDDVEGYALTDADHVAGGIPKWAEVTLTITRDGKQLVHYFTRHDGEAVALAMLKTLHPQAGRPVIGLLWAQLDAVMIELMDDRLRDKAKLQGQALGLATAIATIRAPHAPDLDAVRKEARERYDAR